MQRQDKTIDHGPSAATLPDMRENFDRAFPRGEKGGALSAKQEYAYYGGVNLKDFGSKM